MNEEIPSSSEDFKEPTPPTRGVSKWELEETREEIAQVRAHFNFAPLGLVVLFISVNLFLYQQTSALRAEVVRLVKGIKQMRDYTEHYRTNTAPMMQRFVGDLQSYAQKDPEFARLLAKYPRFSDASPEPQPSGAR